MQTITLTFSDTDAARILEAVNDERPPTNPEGLPRAGGLDDIHAYVDDMLVRLTTSYETRKRQEAVPVPPPVVID